MAGILSCFVLLLSVLSNITQAQVVDSVSAASLGGAPVGLYEKRQYPAQPFPLFGGYGFPSPFFPQLFPFPGLSPFGQSAPPIRPIRPRPRPPLFPPLRPTVRPRPRPPPPRPRPVPRPRPGVRPRLLGGVLGLDGILG
ncbi:keratinocyte proline-rich protein-like [Uloborus diversus]|uniref:keratinocyte proline-rich protein-like n=1 Tax=Uloborus diversus TaxID=327109 RepID=UPI00240A55FB|nr:keratinocyte proline-rich protein-like [Uloborus diversus]